MLALLRRLERDTAGRLLEAGLGERGTKRGDELFADHKGGHVRARPVRSSYLPTPVRPREHSHRRAASLRARVTTEETR